MNTLNIFIQSIISLLFFSLLYKLLLSKSKKFNQNRFFLLFVLALSVTIPFINFQIKAIDSNYSFLLDEISIVANSGNQEFSKIATSSISLTQIVNTIYLIGALGFLTIFTFRLFTLQKILNKKIVDKTKSDIKIIETEEDTEAFSFFNTILMKKNLDENTKSVIIKHEIGHINHNHTIDKILVEIMSIFLWFNPFFWIIRKELHIIHEFQADAASVKTTDKISYMQMLLNMASIKKSNILSNSFNQSFIKRRFKMITKENASKGSLSKFLLTIALTLSIGFLLACSEKSEQIKNVTSNTTGVSPDVATDQPDKEPVYTVVEDMPEFPGGQDKLIEYISSNIKYPKEAIKNGIQGTTFVTFIINKDGSVRDISILRGFDEACDNEAIRVISNMPKWKPGKQRGKVVNVQFNLPVRFKLDEKE